VIECFKNRSVLITGHTGFKGSWLTLWLKQLGANITGISLPPPTNPNLFHLLNLQDQINHLLCDIRDFDSLQAHIQKTQPEVLFHLAAQPIVLDSYTHPKETFDTNVSGSVNVLEACRHTPSIKAIVVITSDKCYDNHETIWGLRENDPLGGKDPYSASKAMTEIVAKSYKSSFNMNIATARAGNVIGGGDFSPHRILPDAIRALIHNQPIPVRNPQSIRPWLYVLDPIYGYLLIAKKLLEENCFAEEWNFGPKDIKSPNVKELIDKCLSTWGAGSWENAPNFDNKPEMQSLKLNWEKANCKLGWSPKYNAMEAIQETVNWYKAYHTNPNSLYNISIECIKNYK